MNIYILRHTNDKSYTKIKMEENKISFFGVDYIFGGRRQYDLSFRFENAIIIFWLCKIYHDHFI